MGYINIYSYLTSSLTWIFFVFGLVIGSFLNVCILRIPEGTFFAKNRSHCPACGAAIPWYLNMPLFSFAYLRGRAQCCGKKISWQYPAVELLTGVMFAVIYWHFPFFQSIHIVNVLGGGIDHNQFLRFLHAATFTGLLIVCSVIDLRLMIIPDIISIPMIIGTPIVCYLHPDLNWQSALIGVVAGGFSLYAVAWIYWLLRHEVGMGMGDVKLLAGIGGWLGYQAILPTILFGSVLGAACGLGAMAVTRRLNLKMAIPFGPFLAVGSLIYFLFGGPIQEWFLK